MTALNLNGTSREKSPQTTEAYLDSFEDETRSKYAKMLVPE
jgi:hypothetical protein